MLWSAERYVWRRLTGPGGSMLRNFLIAVLILETLLIVAFLIAAGGMPGREPPSWLGDRLVAHRGQWTAGPERPENSLAAFEEAAKNGFAIEFDVQSSADGQTVVVHDESLELMTGMPGTVSQMTLAQLKQRRLLGGMQTIPTLGEVLELVGGRVPLFIEVKNAGEVGPLEDDVAEQLKAYDGEVAVMAFNPYSLARVAETAPAIPRGQLSSALRDEGLAFYEVFVLRNLLMNWLSKPDFIAYDLAELPSLATTVQKWRGRPLIGWTATDEAGRVAAEDLVDVVIADPGALP